MSKEGATRVEFAYFGLPDELKIEQTRIANVVKLWQKVIPHKLTMTCYKDTVTGTVLQYKKWNKKCRENMSITNGIVEQYRELAKAEAAFKKEQQKLECARRSLDETIHDELIYLIPDLKMQTSDPCSITTPTPKIRANIQIDNFFSKKSKTK